MLTILITGASSGLGSALAFRYASRDVHLILWGRDAFRLRNVAAECQARGATVDVDEFDVRDIDLTIRRLQDVDGKTPIELAIFNAGIGGTEPTGDALTAAARSSEIAAVNFTAVAVGATTIGEHMKARRHGHIVVVGSIAHSFPLPQAPTYAGAKAGIAMFAEALELRLRDFGVAVTLISPGFIDTPMSRQLSTPKPFMISADQAARLVVRKIAKRGRHATIPTNAALVLAIASLLPRSLIRLVLRRFN